MWNTEPQSLEDRKRGSLWAPEPSQEFLGLLQNTARKKGREGVHWATPEWKLPLWKPSQRRHRQATEYEMSSKRVSKSKERNDKNRNKKSLYWEYRKHFPYQELEKKNPGKCWDILPIFQQNLSINPKEDCAPVI